MRVMVLVKANEDSEAGVMPSERMLAEMGNFNEDLVNAGVIKAGEGLHPSSKGTRVHFRADGPLVVDGPFAETKELVAGFWIWEVESMDEAIAWAKRMPGPHHFDGVPADAESIVEIRPIFEAEDFGEEFTKELREQEDRLRAQIESED